MNKVSCEPGTFICPQGFVESVPDAFLDLDEDEELCLIRTPWEFDVGLLNGKKISLTGSVTILEGDGKCFECASLNTPPAQLRHICTIIPSTMENGELIQVPTEFKHHLAITEALEIPEFDELPVIDQQKDNIIQIPTGLFQRFVPFGSAMPTDTSQDEEDTFVSKTEHLGLKRHKKSKKKRCLSPSAEDMNSYMNGPKKKRKSKCVVLDSDAANIEQEMASYTNRSKKKRRSKCVELDSDKESMKQEMASYMNGTKKKRKSKCVVLDSDAASIKQEMASDSSSHRKKKKKKKEKWKLTEIKVEYPEPCSSDF